jgi:hypothetical protein
MWKNGKTALTILFFFLPVFGAKSQPAEDIEVRIALPEQAVCLPSKSFELELYVTNVGVKEISLSQEWMVSGIEYEVVYDMKQGFGRAAVFAQRSDSISKLDFSRGTPFELATGSTQRAKTERPLDYDFFQKPGFYKVRVHYRSAIREQGGTLRKVQVASNWVLFEVESCRSKPAQ